MTPDLYDQPVPHHPGQSGVAKRHVVVAEFVKRLLLSRRNVVLIVLVKAMQEHQTVTLTVRHDGPVSAPFSSTLGPDTFLDEEAAQPAVDEAILDFESGFPELGVGQTRARCPTVEVIGFEDPTDISISRSDIERQGDNSRGELKAL